MSLEFRVSDGLPIEVSDQHKEISTKGEKRFIVDGGRAFEVWLGNRRERLLEQYEFEHRKPKAPIVFDAPLRVTEEPVEPIAPPVAPTIEETPFIPDPSDWFTCTLSSTLRTVPAVIGELSNGQLCWIHEREFTVKSSGHALCLEKGTQLFVRMEPNDVNPRFPYRALECQVQVEGEEKESHTTGIIMNWTGSLGAARARCGCSIGIGTASRTEQLDLKNGDRVEFDVIFNQRLQKFLGANITVLETKRSK